VSIALNKGDAARRLLIDADFNAVFQELMDENLLIIANSKPNQEELREDAYFRLRGVQDIAYRLNTWVTVAHQLQARQVQLDKQTEE
jgi:hypothetical protein